MAEIPSVGVMEAYIRQAARARGIDPDVAVRVARSEGLAPDTWQSNVQLGYGRERSYGPFQLHVAPKGRNPGLGNAFIKETGMHPSDPSTWRAGIDFALNKAAETGWGDWFGARGVGITGKRGIGANASTLPVSGISSVIGGEDAPVVPGMAKYGIRPQTFAPPQTGGGGILQKVVEAVSPAPKRTPANLVPGMAAYGIRPHGVAMTSPIPGGATAPSPTNPASMPSQAGGILGLLGGLLGSMGGGGEQAAPPPAPPPNIVIPKTDTSIPKFNYMLPPTNREETEEEFVQRLKTMFGVS